MVGAAAFKQFGAAAPMIFYLIITVYVMVMYIYCKWSTAAYCLALGWVYRPPTAPGDCLGSIEGDRWVRRTVAAPAAARRRPPTPGTFFVNIIILVNNIVMIGSPYLIEILIFTE